jgi:hypothetical protein
MLNRNLIVSFDSIVMVVKLSFESEPDTMDASLSRTPHALG